MNRNQMIDVKSAQIFILLLGVVFHFPTWPFPKQEKEGRKYDFYVQILTFQMTNYRRLYVRNSSVLFCRSVQEFCFYCGYFYPKFKKHYTFVFKAIFKVISYNYFF